MVQHDVRIELIVRQVRHETNGYLSVLFDRPINFNYEAGDWIDLDFADTSYKGGKTYSLSSSPTESELSISFRKGISPFKTKLQSVTAGEKLYISEYGNDYGFHLAGNRSSVLIAGGIGIAPFRSMLKGMYDVQDKSTVQLVYLNKNEDFLFRSEIDTWSQALPNFSIDYIATKDLKRKEREKLLQTLISGSAGRYYISGPSDMVEGTSALLGKLGISTKDIRIDNFGTY